MSTVFVMRLVQAGSAGRGVPSRQFSPIHDDLNGHRLMKGKSENSVRMPVKIGLIDPETVAIRVLNCIVGDPERLGRLLATTGLDPNTIRGSAASPGFLAAIMDHVMDDERLLLAISAEAGLDPRELALAQARLSPQPDWDA